MSNNDKSQLSDKEQIESARMLEWMDRADDARYLSHHHASAELIAYSFQRGMSRKTMNNIWGRRLVDATLGVETTNFIEQGENNAAKVPKTRSTF